MGTGWNSNRAYEKILLIITDWDMGTGWNNYTQAFEGD